VVAVGILSTADLHTKFDLPLPPIQITLTTPLTLHCHTAHQSVNGESSVNGGDVLTDVGRRNFMVDNLSLTTKDLSLTPLIPKLARGSRTSGTVTC
jgi:hypothetical protein